MEKNLVCADADTDTKSSRLIASLRIEIEMYGLVIIGYRWIDKHKRVDGMVGIPHTRQFVKEGCGTVNGFEVRNISLLDPNRVHHRLDFIFEAEVEDVFRMRITDGETEGRIAC
jgi:hypothetical protein